MTRVRALAASLLDLIRVALRAAFFRPRRAPVPERDPLPVNAELCGVCLVPVHEGCGSDPGCVCCSYTRELTELREGAREGELGDG